MEFIIVSLIWKLQKWILFKKNSTKLNSKKLNINVIDVFQLWNFFTNVAKLFPMAELSNIPKCIQNLWKHTKDEAKLVLCDYKLKRRYNMTDESLTISGPIFVPFRAQKPLVLHLKNKNNHTCTRITDYLFGIYPCIKFAHYEYTDVAIKRNWSLPLS